MTDLTQRAKDRISVVCQWRGNDDTDAAIMGELLSEVESLRGDMQHIAKQWPDSFAARTARAALQRK